MGTLSLSLSLTPPPYHPPPLSLSLPLFPSLSLSLLLSSVGFLWSEWQEVSAQEVVKQSSKGLSSTDVTDDQIGRDKKRKDNGKDFSRRDCIRKFSYHETLCCDLC
jgi:hypothetical protein